jgi:hypothetical protein
MSHKTAATVAQTIGIDPGKNTLHLIGLDDKGAIVLREKVARGRIAARLANVLHCFARFRTVKGRRIPRQRAANVAKSSRACPRRSATCSTAFALLEMCPARMADAGRSGKRRKGKGAVREPSGAKPKRRKGRWRRIPKRNCVVCVPERSCAMPAPWMRSSRRRRWAARQVPSR